MIEEFQMESMMNTENDESGLTPLSRQNIEEIDEIGNHSHNDFTNTQELTRAL